jgi:hypothetical protein
MTDSAEPVGALEELAETVYLNETLGEPSACVAEKLFATIDAEEARSPRRRRHHRPAPNTALSTGVASLAQASSHPLPALAPGSC